MYKRSRLHEMERFQLAREICLHIRILHPYILALFAAWKDSKYVYLALEWAPRCASQNSDLAHFSHTLYVLPCPLPFV